VRYIFTVLEGKATSRLGHSYEAYISVAQTSCYCVRAMQSLYAAVKSSNIAQICLNPNRSSFEVQLPPHLDSILYTETNEQSFANEKGFDSQGWGLEMEVGWYLPVLAPWKALLMQDDDHRSVLGYFEGRNANKVSCQGINNSVIASLGDLSLFLKEVRITRR
jgi:hypothetical protein